MSHGSRIQTNLHTSTHTSGDVKCPIKPIAPSNCNPVTVTSQNSNWHSLSNQLRLKFGTLASTVLINGLLLGSSGVPALAQTATEPPPVPSSKESDAPPVQPQVPLVNPKAMAPDALTVKPLAAGEYILEFNRSPVVGNRFRLRGIYDEARLRFTRPRNWEPTTVKLALRYRHSGALYATRSNLTVLFNGASIGSIPLNRKQGELGTALFDVPPRLIQDQNEVVIAALQNNSPTCTQDPFDPSLWSEIMPDSKLVFNFRPQPIALDFNRYPYPVFDTLNLGPSLVAHLLPKKVDASWLSATARYQTALGRYAQFRPLETRMVEQVTEAKPNERLLIIGPAKSHPAIAELNLPLPLENGQLLGADNKPLPADVGVLILTTTPNQENVVLIATGNGERGVAKAVQFLGQARDRQLGTGRLLLIQQVESVPSPPLREWRGFLPPQSSFAFKDLKDFNEQPLTDVTVRGSDAPPIEFDFKALPDDRFGDRNFITLNYSYSPQANPLTSLVELQIDGLPVVGRRLDKEGGAVRDTLKAEIPGNLIRPNSKLQVRFQLDSREQRSCNRAIDQQLWGTVHMDTQVELDRQVSAQIPDLKLLQFGYPFAEPQDLSRTVMVLPQKPGRTDLLLMLQFAERLGRISRSDAIKLNVYRADELSDEHRRDRHLVAIGTQANFPLPEAFKAEGFVLQDWFRRQREQSQVVALPDQQGVIKSIVSPWNPERVLLAFTGQTEQGLAHGRDLLKRDDLFFQLREDTVLISANSPEPMPYDPQAYTLEFLQQAVQRQRVAPKPTVANWLTQWNAHWFLLVPGTVAGAMILYGVLQALLKRVIKEQKNEC